MMIAGMLPRRRAAAAAVVPLLCRVYVKNDMK